MNLYYFLLLGTPLRHGVVYGPDDTACPADMPLIVRTRLHSWVRDGIYWVVRRYPRGKRNACFPVLFIRMLLVLSYRCGRRARQGRGIRIRIRNFRARLRMPEDLRLLFTALRRFRAGHRPGGWPSCLRLETGLVFDLPRIAFAAGWRSVQPG